MKITRRRMAATSIAVFGLLTPVLMFSATGQAEDTKTPNKQITASQKFKNIKVLKDLPEDQLIPLMKQFNKALGVKCSACHVINPDHTGFEKDDKRMKSTARDMIRMTNDINKRYKVIDKKATCFMCHQGHEEPVTHPTVDTNEPDHPEGIHESHEHNHDDQNMDKHEAPPAPAQ